MYIYLNNLKIAGYTGNYVVHFESLVNRSTKFKYLGIIRFESCKAYGIGTGYPGCVGAEEGARYNTHKDDG